MERLCRSPAHSRYSAPLSPDSVWHDDAGSNIASRLTSGRRAPSPRAALSTLLRSALSRCHSDSSQLPCGVWPNVVEPPTAAQFDLEQFYPARRTLACGVIPPVEPCHSDTKRLVESEAAMKELTLCARCR